ncbi:hypothetical protein CSW65_13135 [Streptococcus agalactiae]|nr:hypothetical protein CSW65_13135 [Streptococcus agalactiae]
MKDYQNKLSQATQPAFAPAFRTRKGRGDKEYVISSPTMSVRFLNSTKISSQVLNTTNLKKLLKSLKHSLGLKKKGYGRMNRPAFVLHSLMINIGLPLVKNI